MLYKMDDSLFKIPVEEQRQFLERLSEPKDDLERAFRQYQCQMFLSRHFSKIMINIASFPILTYLLAKYRKKGKTIYDERTVNAIFLPEGKGEEILPDSLKKEYKEICSLENYSYSLNQEDICYFFRLMKRYPLSGLFLLKCLIKVAQYRFILDNYKPKAIIVCAEYSYTSSILTDWCRRNHVSHINVMHGEKMYHIMDAFAHFDRFYVWDEFYKGLLVELREEDSQFLIEVPDALKLASNMMRDPEYDFTYYLGDEKTEVLQTISLQLKKLVECGYKISIRCHPRYSDVEIVKTVFGKGFNVEIPKEVSLVDSLTNTKSVISLFSTVMNQAIHSGKRVIVDDLSDQGRYNKLRELSFRFVNDKRVIRLSELLESSGRKQYEKD